MAKGGFGGFGVLAGVDDIVERHLGIGDIGSTQPRFGTRAVCKRLNGAPPQRFDAAAMVQEVLSLLEVRWRASAPARIPSAQNWRFEKQLWIAPHNTSAEKTLEKAIARSGGEAWANQVPTGSGLINGSNDKHRNLDLVFRRAGDCFELIELKMTSDTPLYAAIEMLLYGVLYLFTRLHIPAREGVAAPVQKARAVHVRVLAPAAYYRGLHFDWLETALTEGLRRTVAKHAGLPEVVDFAFMAFPANFAWPCSDEGLAAALEGRGPAGWSG